MTKIICTKCGNEIELTEAEISSFLGNYRKDFVKQLEEKTKEYEATLADYEKRICELEEELEEEEEEYERDIRHERAMARRNRGVQENF